MEKKVNDLKTRILPSELLIKMGAMKLGVLIDFCDSTNSAVSFDNGELSGLWGVK